MTIWDIIGWLIIGLIAGWLASVVMGRGGYGIVGDIVVGLRPVQLDQLDLRRHRRDHPDCHRARPVRRPLESLARATARHPGAGRPVPSCNRCRGARNTPTHSACTGT